MALEGNSSILPEMHTVVGPMATSGPEELVSAPWSGFGAQEQDLVSSLGHLTVQENRMSPETVQEEDPRGCAHDTDMRADAGVVLRGPAAAPTTALPRTFTHVYTRKRRCRKNQD